MALSRRRRQTLAAQGATLVLLVVFLFPYIWLVSSSFKPAGEIFAVPPRLLPAQPTLDNFARIVGRADIQRFFLNSAIIAAVTVSLNVLFSSAAAYALTTFRFRGQRLLTMLTLVTQLFPAVIIVIPLYRLWASLGLLNTYQALVFTYVAVTLPLGVWMLSGYMRTIPFEVVEAALVDGCNRVQLFTTIVAPLARPGIAATAVYVMLVSWNGFIYAVTFTSAKEMRTVSAGLYGFLGEMVYDYHLLLAMAVVIKAVLPTMDVKDKYDTFAVKGRNGNYGTMVSISTFSIPTVSKVRSEGYELIQWILKSENVASFTTNPSARAADATAAIEKTLTQ